MILKQTDKELIAKHKCSTRRCKEKSSGIKNGKFYCNKCYNRNKEFKRIFFDNQRLLRLRD